MSIYSQTYLVAVKVKCRIEVLQECITHNVDVFVFATKFTFTQDEVTFSTVSLEQVLSWLQLKNSARHIETYRS
jgi:hypothetical protein